MRESRNLQACKSSEEPWLAIVMPDLWMHSSSVVLSKRESKESVKERQVKGRCGVEIVYTVAVSRRLRAKTARHKVK